MSKPLYILIYILNLLSIKLDIENLIILTKIKVIKVPHFRTFKGSIKVLFTKEN